jgi:hypothetical protein
VLKIGIKYRPVMRYIKLLNCRTGTHVSTVCGVQEIAVEQDASKEANWKVAVWPAGALGMMSRKL